MDSRESAKQYIQCYICKLNAEGILIDNASQRVASVKTLHNMLISVSWYSQHQILCIHLSAHCGCKAMKLCSIVSNRKSIVVVKQYVN